MANPERRVGEDRDRSFDSINAGYDAVFQPNNLSVGLVVPIESYPNSAIPTMSDHIQRIQLAENLGFSAVWLRDVPFNVPSFGDAGQVLDPFVYLGALATQTSQIALGVSSIILPLRHPAHVAKAAATADVLSNGRLLLGIASGDRPEEYPAIDMSFHNRGERFRESYEYLRRVGETNPCFSNSWGSVRGGMDMLPKPAGQRLPLLITGSSQQSNAWIAANADGWMTYPRSASLQSSMIDAYRKRLLLSDLPDKPVTEPLYIDLDTNPNASPRPIHLGLHLGVKHLREYLESRRAIGVNHVALNLRFNRSDTEATLRILADELIPEFSR